MSEALVKEVAVLLFTDIVGSVRMQQQLGTEAYTQAVSRHDLLMRKAFDLAAEPPKILKETGDGVLAKFKSASGAVEAALRIQYLLHKEKWEDGREVRVRIGVHLGEVTEMAEEITGEKRAVGMAINLAARVMDLSEGGQILMTRSVFDDARQFISRHPSVGGDDSLPTLPWPAHGRYLFKGYDEALDIFEVGAEKIAPLAPPEGGNKAKRAVAADEEATLGWRPGVGLDIPRREDWSLIEKIGIGGFGEVWLAKHEATREERVFKFCFDAERLRSFKRELTLFRLLRDALGKRKDIAALYDVSVDEPPFFLESEYVPTGNLALWAEAEGGIENVPMATRIKLLADAARAAGAAHSVGIIHKDLKPSNILVAVEDGEPQPRLADFGIGTLASSANLEDFGITDVGFTVSIQHESGSHTSGTQLYTAPEYVVGAPPSVQGDIYALGVILYQMVAGDLIKPLGSGWQRHVEDELLCKDIERCVDLDPAQRFETAYELAERLETLEERREAKLAAEKQQKVAAMRRRFAMMGGLVVLVLAVVIGILVYAFVQEQQREKEARVMASDLDFRIGSQSLENGRADVAVAHLARAIRSNPENVSAARKLMAILAHRDFIAPASGPHAVGGAGNRRYNYEVAVSPDSSRIAVSHTDASKVGIWDLETGETVHEALDAGEGIWEMRWVGNDRLVTNDLKRVRVFDTESGEVVRELSEGSGLLDHTGEKYFNVMSQERVELKNPVTGEVLAENLPLASGSIREMTFEPNGKWIIALFIDPKPQPRRVLRLLEFTDGKAAAEWREIGVAPGTYQAPQLMFTSEDATLAAVPDADGAMKIWRVPEAELLHNFYMPGNQALVAAFSADSQKIVIGYFGKNALVWDLTTGRKSGATLTHEGGVARLLAKYRKKIPPVVEKRDERIKYAAFVETLDHYVGEVLRGLEAAGKGKNTLVVFTSDNGGHPEYAANGPMRGSKWNLYEGGIRVPLIMRWPGKLPKGEACRTPVCGYDLLPTFAEVAGKAIDPEKEGLDGRSLAPLFAKPEQRFDRSLYWHFPYYHPEGTKFGKCPPAIGVNDFQVSQTRPVSALRYGSYKLLHYYEDDRVELYNLDSDRSEAQDLAKAAPESAQKLKSELQRILKEVKARMPTGVIARQ